MKRVIKVGGSVAGYVWDFAGNLNVVRHVLDPLKAFNPDLPQVPGTESSRIKLSLGYSKPLG